MLWEKKTNLKSKRGYLYLRETVYKRDKRTLLKRAKRFGDGSATENRGRYSVKKDTYCGKIIETKATKLISFNDYIKERGIEFLEYKIKSTFDEILMDFVNYIIFVHNIDKKEYENSKKKLAYYVGSGYLCSETVDFVRRFIVKSEPMSSKEIERFANRCLDCGIYDMEIIMTLYVKLIATQKPEEIKKEEEYYKEIEEAKYGSYEDFMKNREDNLF